MLNVKVMLKSMFYMSEVNEGFEIVWNVIINLSNTWYAFFLTNDYIRI